VGVDADRRRPDIAGWPAHESLAKWLFDIGVRSRHSVEFAVCRLRRPTNVEAMVQNAIGGPKDALKDAFKGK
jgi:hypothetical protein